MVVASVREGYGLMAVEAAACGTPSVVVANPENVATGRITESLSGLVYEPTAAEIADGIVRAIAADKNFRTTTAAWYADHAEEMGMARVVSPMVELFASLDQTRPLSMGQPGRGTPSRRRHSRQPGRGL